MYYFGIDLGREMDPSAVALVVKAGPHPVYGTMAGGEIRRVIGLERVPLGTPYLVVVERVRAMVSRTEFAGNCSIAVDATGVGAPVVESLRASLAGCDVKGVKVTAGEKETQKGLDYTVPKQDLMGGLQVLLERGELKVSAGLPEAWALKKELLNVRMTGNGKGGFRIGADRAGEHDDLVFAVALACWSSKQRYVGYGRTRLPGI